MRGMSDVFQQTVLFNLCLFQKFNAAFLLYSIFQRLVSFVVFAHRPYHGGSNQSHNAASALNYNDSSWFQIVHVVASLPVSSLLPTQVAIPCKFIYWHEVGDLIEMLKNMMSANNITTKD